jgi:putative addiction module component (TIGR02574 family)
MIFDLERVAQEALALPTEARAALAERLLQSLDDGELTEIEEARIQEAERRYEELKTEKVKGIPAHEVFAEIRQEIGCKP